MDKMLVLPSHDGGHSVNVPQACFGVLALAGDTGFLNAFFPDWYLWPPDQRLPFRYNALRTMYWRLACKPSLVWLNWLNDGPHNLMETCYVVSIALGQAEFRFF